LEKRVGNYERFARAYVKKAEINAYNSLYERPALISLLPELKEKRILDAGCGGGSLSEEILKRGGEVTALDRSDEMIKIAFERLKDRCTLIQADLCSPLDFFTDASFDVVVSSLVLHYIKDWSNLLKEINRILIPGGEFIFSTHHPFQDLSDLLEVEYFETQLVEDYWEGFLNDPVLVRYYRRSLGEMFKEYKKAGFTVTDLVEPLPLVECKEKFPKDYEVLSKKPVFILFKLKKC